MESIQSRSAIASAMRARRRSSLRRLSRIPFKKITEETFKQKSRGWKNPTHRHQWRMSLDVHILPKPGEMPIADAKVEHVRRVLDPIWETNPVMADRIRGRIAVIWDSGKVPGCCHDDNPAAWNDEG
jgi:hypothetical protein